MPRSMVGRCTTPLPLLIRLRSGPRSARPTARSIQSQARWQYAGRPWLSKLLFATPVVAGLAYLYDRDVLRVPLVLAEADSEDKGISVTDLAKHNQLNSAWVAVHGEVWDVTDWIPHHPGGSQILMEHAGKDVTKLFDGIHPPNTIENSLERSQLVGRLSEEAVSYFEKIYNDDKLRIQTARDALIGIDSVVTLNDFEKYARDCTPTTAWEYYSTGADTETALRANASIYDEIFFRPRVMRKVKDVDPSTEFLGYQSAVPIYATPTAAMGLGQSMGEVAVTIATGKSDILHVLSHVASKSLEEVLDARKEGQKVAWQLYVKPDRSLAEEEIRKAHELGVQSIWLTLDRAIGGKNIREREGQAGRNPAPHAKSLTRGPSSELSSRHDPDITWEDIAWIRKLAPGIPIVLKGIGAWEDVVLARHYGADAVVLSNHGGRQLDFADPPLQTLLDMNTHCPDLLRQPDFPVFVDGGIRRGTDVLKALCLGARAVGVGRPFIYAATGWGPEGVERAVQILREEVEIGMRLLGVTKLDQLGPEYLNLSRLHRGGYTR